MTKPASIPNPARAYRPRKAFAEDAAEVFASLVKHGPSNARQISNRLDLSQGTITNHLRRMLALNTVLREDFKRVVTKEYQPPIWSINKAFGTPRALDRDPVHAAFFKDFTPVNKLPAYAAQP